LVKTTGNLGNHANCTILSSSLFYLLGVPKLLTLIPISVTKPNHFDEFVLHLQQLGRSEKTITEYARYLKNYSAYLNRFGFALPSRAAWLQWQVSPQQKRLAGYAVRAYQEFLAQILGEPERDFGVPKRLPPPPRPNPRPLEYPDQLVRRLSTDAKQILTHDAGLSVRVFIRVLRELGVRRSEAGGIGWNDINWRERSILIRGKGDKFRTLPLSRKLCKLFALLRRRSVINPWIGGRGQVLNAKGLADLLKKVAVHARFPTLKCHAFRATRLTEIGNAANFNPLLYQAFSGHANLSTARYYVRPALERMRAMLNCR
jgi:integrase